MYSVKYLFDDLITEICQIPEVKKIILEYDNLTEELRLEIEKKD